MPIANPVPPFKNPEAVGSGFGRFFYGVDNVVYFSQVLTTSKNAGKCYQRNDPTSDTIPDLLDTDGGVIPLDGAIRIRAFQQFRLGILVFCDNGLWYIYGQDGGFKATGYNLSKISERGIDSPKSIVSAEGSVFYFSDNGIMQVVANEFDNIDAVDITETTIKKYYIDNFVGKSFRAFYNSTEKEIWWTTPQQITGQALVLDLVSQAFYPQVFESDRGYANVIKTDDTVLYPNYYTDSGGDELFYNFATRDQTDFKDFGEDISAYMLTGPESLGVFSNKKNVTTAHIHFRKTEKNVTGSNPDGSYIFDFPSSCLMNAYFDFDTNDTYNNISRQKQVYRPNLRGFLVDSIPASFDNGQTVVSYKDTIRGSGKSVAFRFEAEPEKDLQLLGYSVEYSMRGRQ